MMRVSDPVSAMLIEGWSDSITELTASSALRSLSTRPSGRPNSSELPSGADAYPLWSSQEDQSPGLGQQGEQRRFPPAPCCHRQGEAEGVHSVAVHSP